MKRLSLSEMLHLLLGANIVLWLNSGTYQLISNAIPNFIKLGLVALWFAISMIRRKSFLSRFSVVVYLLALFYLICTMAKLAGIDSYYTNYGTVLLYTMIQIAVFCYYYYYGSKYEIKFLLAVFFLDMTIILIRTFIMLQGNPDIVRALSTGSRHKHYVFGNNIPKGIGAYGFCYQLVILQPLLTYWLNKKRVNLAIKVLIYGLILIFLFQAQITLALVLYPLLLFISHLFAKKERPTQVLGKLLLVVIAGCLIALLPAILQKLIQSSEVHLATRLEELYDLLTARDASGNDMQARMSLYKKSLNSFFSSPLWGAFGGNAYGAHSTLFDILGAFGILGLIGYVGIFRAFHLAKSNYVHNIHALSVMRTTMFVTIFISMLNVIMSSDILLTLLVIVPLSMRYIADEQEEQTQGDLPQLSAYAQTVQNKY